MLDIFKYRHRNWWLLLFLLLGFFLRMYKLGNHGIWHDEKWCISTAVGVPYIMMEKFSFKIQEDSSASNKYFGEGYLKNLKSKTTFSSRDFWHFNNLPGVTGATIFANNSILYFLTLHYWIDTFGISDFSTRFLSLLFGIGTILVVYFISKILFKDFKIALLAVLLAALCPLLIFESQEAKSHSMATFLAALATLLFLRFFKGREKNYLYLLYGLAVAASLLSHMLVIHIFIGHALAMLLFCRIKETWLKYILANAVAIGIYLFWLLNGGFHGIEFLSLFDKNAAMLAKNWKPGDNTFYMPANFVNTLKGLLQILLPLFGNGAQNLGLHLSTLFPFLVIPGLLIWIGFAKEKSYDKYSFSILSAILFTQVAFIIVISSLKGHIIFFQPIYGSVHGVPYAMIIMAFAIFQIKSYSRKRRTFLYTLVIIQMIIMIISWFPTYNDQRERNPYYTLAHNIEASYTTGDTIIYSSWNDAQIVNLYIEHKKDALQKVDTTIKNKTLLGKHDSSQREELFNFQNGKLRY
jgi:uncharacterized membrane protein